MATPGDPSVAFPAFPFEPYPIQLQFMRVGYNGIQKRGVTIVESPTETGKTLHLICSALQWLIDQHGVSTTSAGYEGNVSNPAEEEPDWMSNFEAKEEEEKRKRKGNPKQTLRPRVAHNSLKWNHAKSNVEYE